MVGIFSHFLVAGLLSANPAGFTFDGPEVTARTVGNIGYFTQGATPYADLFERGQGTARFSARERIADPRATYGDAGSLDATFTLGATTYRVELDKAGFPPDAQLRAPPAQSIAGGVVLNQELHGGAALGAPTMTRVHAAAALWGVGRLWRNGQLITDKAFVHVAALDRGAHADDDTFRVLPVARAGDAELNILVWNLPRRLEPRGFIQFDFDDVAIAVNGLDMAVVASVPSAGAFVGVAPPNTQVLGHTFLGGVSATVGSGGAPSSGTGGSGLPNFGQELILEQQRLTGNVAQTTGLVTSATTSVPSTTNVTAPSNSLPILNSQSDQNAVLSGGVSSPTSAFAPTGSVTPFTQGSFSIAPLTTEATDPGSAFGGDRVAVGIVATPSPLNSGATTAPLVASPQPLNAQTLSPLVSSPQPFNSSPAAPLISTPQPLNVQPLSATPPGAVVPGTTGF